MPATTQSITNKALAALANENAILKDLVHSLQELPLHAWPQLKFALGKCLT